MTDASPDGSHVGFTCPADHPVFGPIGETLRAHGHAVTFFEPPPDVPASRLETLTLLVSKTVSPSALRTLCTAERLGVPTWNSATGVLVCSARLTQLRALAAVGFEVPPVSLSPPDGEYVAKGRYHWDHPPVRNGEGALYEPLLPADPLDYKYYVVDDGTEYRAAVVRATSKLTGPKEIRGRVAPDPDHVDRIAALMERLDLRGVGVDLLCVDDDWYAVDLNPCPSFVGTGLESTLVDAIEHCVD